MFENRICKHLGIRYPIILGGMAWASSPELCAAVCEAGGLGTLASALLPLNELRGQIRLTRELTKKDFCLNLVPVDELTWDRAAVAYDEGVPIISTGFGDPQRSLVAEARGRGVKVLAVVPSVRLAKRMEKEGADAIIASGHEAGGHVGKITTFALVPRVVDAVKIPVIAAGGIGDARGLVAALALGASGVQMGTRFMATKECRLHPNFKELLLRATEEDTVVTEAFTRSTMRVIANRYTRQWLKPPVDKEASMEVRKIGVEKIRKALIEGEVEECALPAGQVLGLVEDLPSVGELMKRIISGAKIILQSFAHYERIFQAVEANPDGGQSQSGSFRL